jgi:hypothetical protein
MTFRLPGRRDTELSPLEAEVMSEKAAALAQTGRKVEAALTALAEAGEDRPQRLRRRWTRFIPSSSNAKSSASATTAA